MSPVVLHQGTLDEIKNGIEQGVDARLRLLTAADEWLAVSSSGVWTVTQKSTCAPSANIHDYYSKAPYWFPAETADGLPYIRRDGQISPEALTLDKVNKAKVFQSCHILYVAEMWTDYRLSLVPTRHTANVPIRSLARNDDGTTT
ncbi:hypothetical protein LTR09_006328 [Extremus antarcticus]|uniref:Alginate lyase domain-containing protein n=1 Tax=Extremus antarcticus TaxID=702011 RepID=A0AAJ0DL55_9PEZI|nr:hypothetical protein LTR09_006328 [Extremus antarcticus]